jgi:WD40 repeat protein
VRHVRVEPPAGLAKGWATADRLLGAVAFTSDDRGIIVAANDGRVCLLDVRGAVVSYWPHDAEVKALAVADGRLATSGSDGRLRVWDSARALLWRQDVEVADHLSWSDDGRLAVASRTGALSVWSIDGQELARTAIDGLPVGVGFWKGAVVTGAADGQIQVWRVPQERESE